MNKSYIPTKTKIAAWIMTVIGGIGIIGSLLLVILAIREEREIEIAWALFLIGVVVFVLGLLHLLSGIILFTRKRIAWIVSVGILCIEILFLLVYIDYVEDFVILLILLLLFLFTLILLLLDRKNYWRIAS